MNTPLNRQLEADTHRIGEFEDSLLLLSKNALFPWFILVPSTHEKEFHKMSLAQQAKVQQQINSIAQFIEEHFPTDKINIASIGNIVPQLHIHIIGRNQNDACWPGVVWGTEHTKPYTEGEVNTIKEQLINTLKGRLKYD